MAKYNKLTVVEINNVFKSGKKRAMATCLCDCGKTTCVPIEKLKSGHTKSCGCYWLSTITKHGLSGHKLKTIYTAMIYRCNPKKAHMNQCKNYSGRGITVCDEWRNSFLVFYNWCIANGWTDGLEIDRIDNDGNYSPENCRIVTRKVNVNNRRTTRYVQYNGEKRLVYELAPELQICYTGLCKRINKGKTGDDLFKPSSRRKVS